LEWLRASASMPLASEIVSIDGRKLLDGGISDSIPLRFMEKNGYEKNVVILTQPRGYMKKQGKSSAIIRTVYREYPEFVKSCINRPEMYNNQLKYIAKAEKEGRAFVIAPPEKLPVGHIEHNPDVMLEVYRTGRKTAFKSLEKLLKFRKLC
ncbi:MAG: patatin-like phospholipase family protein, partial [Ruminococcus sp.]|nr:patatin-like phospholipase family protein [Ruminococcus sp.]